MNFGGSQMLVRYLLVDKKINSSTQCTQKYTQTFLIASIRHTYDHCSIYMCTSGFAFVPNPELQRPFRSSRLCCVLICKKNRTIFTFSHIEYLNAPKKSMPSLLKQPHDKSIKSYRKCQREKQYYRQGKEL